MSSDMFTQTLCVLLKTEVSLEAIAEALATFHPKRQRDGQVGWEFSGPALVLEIPDLETGYVVVDLVTRPWPDDMGFDQQESTLFQAWDSGQFGPYTFPGSLERATEQSWGWPDGDAVRDQCVGFIRVRLGYHLDDENESENELSQEFDPVSELESLTRICSELLRMPQAICYFNPSGEVLRDRETFQESESLFSRLLFRVPKSYLSRSSYSLRKILSGCSTFPSGYNSNQDDNLICLDGISCKDLPFKGPAMASPLT